MKIPPASSFFTLLVLVASTAVPCQVVPTGAPVPPGYAQAAPTVYVPPYPSHLAASRVDPVALQREGKQLLELSQSVQPDFEALKRGLLPKDLMGKLKRIEKLSKHLRGEIAPLGN
ncbi:MAG: hypothetical protein WAL32_02500 [Terriglobales bacterium]